MLDQTFEGNRRSEQMESEKVKIEWVQKLSKTCLKFVFGERLTSKEAERAIIKWRTEFQSKPDKSINIIWDCRRMKGYDSEAREKWTYALKEMKSQIDTIWLITESSIIKMGASLMSLFSTLDIKVVSSENKIAI